MTIQSSSAPTAQSLHPKYIQAPPPSIPPCLHPIRKPPNRIRINTQIVPPPRLIHSINRNHLLGPNLTQTKPLHTRIPLNTKNLVLAVPKPARRFVITAIRTILLEKAVQAATIYHHILAIQDTQTESVAYSARRTRRRVIGVVVGVGAAVGLAAGVGVGHVVWSFGLDEAGEDGAGGVELVLVEGVVLDAVGPQEHVGGFDVQPAASEDGDACAVPVVDVVVGGLGGGLVCG